MGKPSDFDAKASTWDSDPAKVERARRVADAIALEVPDLGRRTVLDYGAGTGLLGFELLPRALRVTFADVSTGMLGVVKEKIARGSLGNTEVVLLDLSRDPAPPDRYDLVSSLLVLHHVEDVDGLLRAFHSVLAPGGVLALSDLDTEDGSFHGPGFTGHRGFSRDDLANRIERAGFRAPRFSTPFVIEKTVGMEPGRFPAFLAVARRD
jgi:2-polyprenyl-3-methyl-5-hydroxy-6-metoxy-1,4-benzoquinol methylase